MSIAIALVRKKNPELFQAIGEFFYQFSQLEASIRIMLGELAVRRNHDQVLAAFDFAMMCKVLQSVIETNLGAPDDERSRMVKCLNAALEVNTDRVRIAHGTWSVDSLTGHLSSLARGNLSRTDYFTTPKELASLSDRVGKIHIDLLEAYLPHRDAMRK